MAVTEEQFKARFRERFKTIALSNKTLDALAAKVAPTLPDETDEAGIDAHLDFLNGLHPDGAFLAMQKADDKTVNEKKKQEQIAKPEVPTATIPQTLPTPDDKYAALLERLERMEQANRQLSKQQKGEEYFKDLPTSLRTIAIKNMPEDPEQQQAYAEEYKTAYTAALQEQAGSSFGDGKVARGTQSQNKQPSKEEIAAIMKKMS